MLDRTHAGWLASDDYEVAAELRRADAEHPPPSLLDRLLHSGGWRDDDPPTAPAPTPTAPR